MKLYAQHGWGKGEKINRGLSDRVIGGVILSPRDETPTEMQNYVGELARIRTSPDLLFDPQLYLSLIDDVADGALPQYPYYRQNLGLRDFATLRSVQQMVRECIDFQRRLQLSYITSPGVCAENFSDRATQISLTLAQESIEYWRGLNDNRPLLVSLVFAETALSNSQQVSEFLDTISLLETQGFYLLIDRNSPVYSQDFDPIRLAQVMRMIYSLKRSRFQVVCGYSDFTNVMYSAMNADAGATGWSQKLRRFNRGRFQPSAGGRRPRDRYSSSRLINSIYLTELDSCQDVGQLDAVKSGTPYDRCFDGRTYPSGISWSSEDAALQHWASISQILQRINQRTVRARIDELRETITTAQDLYRNLSRLGVTFEPPNGSAHLDNWAEAITMFASEVRI